MPPKYVKAYVKRGKTDNTSLRLSLRATTTLPSASTPWT
jgi:hypothetical protein